MNENLVVEEDTIYEVDPVCMRKKEKEKNNIDVQRRQLIKKVEYSRKNNLMFLSIVLLLLVVQ